MSSVAPTWDGSRKDSILPGEGNLRIGDALDILFDFISVNGCFFGYDGCTIVYHDSLSRRF